MTDTAGRNPPVMPPGRELDALVSRDVFGHSVVQGLIDMYVASDGFDFDDRLPHYSTSWDAMRLVVERMVALGWTVTVRAMEGNATCSLVNRQPGRSTVYEHGDTLSHAVALAALKATTSAQQGAEGSHE